MTHAYETVSTECEGQLRGSPYKLGETINLTMELGPKRDMQVREGRVDLVCEES